MFFTRVLLKKAKSKDVMVLMESVVSGHQFNLIRERLADKLEIIKFDPYIQRKSLYKERKKVTQTDDLPKVICATCFIKIESIDKFAYLAAKTEETYYTWLKRSNEINLITTPSLPTGSESQDGDPNKLILKTYRNPRNPRHVDHITLEQIINDQIVRNPKVLGVPLEMFNPDISSVAYHELKIGQLIKDEELLKLMLKALKWTELGSRRYTGKYWLKKLKAAKFREVLSNPNLLNDADLLQILKSYMGQDALTLLSQAVPPPPRIQLDDDVTQMEVGVDPALFFDDDSRTQTPDIRNDRKFLCTMCPETFLLNSELQNHVLTHLLNKQPASTSKKRPRFLKGGVLQDSGNLPLPDQAKKKRTRASRKKKSVAVVENLENVPSEVVDDVANSEPPKVEIIRIPPNMNPALLNLPEEPPKEKKQKRKQKIKIKEDLPSEPEVTNAEKPIADTPDEKPKKKKEEKYACKKCRKRFSSRSHLKTHTKSEHNTSSKFACDTCHKIFTSKSTLMEHILSHAFEKRHKCITCKKIFSKQRDLKIHMASHNNDKPYPCSHCKRNFASFGNQKLHEKRIHTAQSRLQKKNCRKRKSFE